MQKASVPMQNTLLVYLMVFGIHTQMPASKEQKWQKKWVRHRAYQSALLVDTESHDAAKRAGDAVMDTYSCLYERFGRDRAISYVRAIEKRTVNTKNRFIAYDKFNTSMNGQSFVLKDGDGCGD